MATLLCSTSRTVVLTFLDHYNGCYCTLSVGEFVKCSVWRKINIFKQALCHTRLSRVKFVCQRRFTSTGLASGKGWESKFIFVTSESFIAVARGYGIGKYGWTRLTSVKQQINFQVSAGFCWFLGFWKLENIETQKSVWKNHLPQSIGIERWTYTTYGNMKNLIKIWNIRVSYNC